jgi:hypothetical protein
VAGNGAAAVTAFGHLPRTRIYGGEAGSWLGQNSLFGGIEVYRVPNMAGVWAQEYWEWRLHALWAAASAGSLAAGTAALYALHSWVPLMVGLLGFGLGLVVGLGNRAAREIYSHAITLEAAMMLALPCSEDEMIGSLTTYSYCRGISRDGLLARLRSERPKARRWCEAKRARIARLTVM